MLKLCAVFSLCAGLTLGGDYFTNQAARLVIGQTTFTSQNSGADSITLGALSGLAYAANTLFVADSNRMGLIPANNRVLLFSTVLQTLPQPADEIAVGYGVASEGSCNVCGGQATTVLGEPDFLTTTYTVAANGMRLPTAVASDGNILVVADTANNRVLIWKSIPSTNGQPADLVLGQPDFVTIGPVVVNQQSFRAPQGVWIQNGKLYVADTQNNRVMIWNSIPTHNNQPADLVLGQPNFTTAPQLDLTQQNLTGAANTMLSPVSVTSDGTHLFVTDLGFNRVLIWNEIPTQNQQPADVEVGQLTFAGSTANDTTNLCASNGTDSSGNPLYPVLCAATLNFPRFALSDGTRLYIADGGNDRVLVYETIPTQNATRADVILGEPDEFSDIVTSNTSIFTPNLTYSASNSTPTPTSLAWDGQNLYVADPTNYRVLVFTPETPSIAANGIVNTASLAIYAVGTVTMAGTITADDTVTLTIGNNAGSTPALVTGTAYTYKILKADTFDTVAQALVTQINASNGGAGDPNVFAAEELGYGVMILTARQSGPAGNNVSLTTTVSSNATITATDSGATLTGGGSAATLAPGALASIFGVNLADTVAAADLTQANLPVTLGNVEVYVDGIRTPIEFVSPTQINVQLPFEIVDTNSSSLYVRTQHNDGSVTVSDAVGLPIAPDNPGIFAKPGSDPRPGMAVHGSSYASGVVSVNGSIAAGDVGTITLGDHTYTYTIQATDTLTTVVQAFVSLIDADPEAPAIASVAAAFTQIVLQSKIPGPLGNGLALSATQAAATSGGTASIVLSATNTALCCANVAGAPITPDNPAEPGEQIIVYGTGLGIVGPQEAQLAINDGSQYQGPAVNSTNDTVSSFVGGTAPTVIGAGLVPGSFSVYAVVLQLNSGLSANPLTQVTISQSAYTSNIVTIPVGTAPLPIP